MKFETIIGTITLTTERKTHISQRHPIIDDYFIYLKEALEVPDDIRYSSYNNTILLFYRYFDNIEDGKYIAVVVNNLDL